MNKIPTDLLVLIALETDLPDILSLCLVNQDFNQKICKNKNFWIRLIKREYPEVDLSNVNEYRKLYKYLSKRSEEIDELELDFAKDGDIIFENMKGYYVLDSELYELESYMGEFFFTPEDFSFPDVSPYFFKNVLENVSVKDTFSEEAVKNTINKTSFVTGKYNEKYPVKLLFPQEYVNSEDLILGLQNINNNQVGYRRGFRIFPANDFTLFQRRKKLMNGK